MARSTLRVTDSTVSCGFTTKMVTKQVVINPGPAEEYSDRVGVCSRVGGRVVLTELASSVAVVEPIPADVDAFTLCRCDIRKTLNVDETSYSGINV